MPRFGLNGATTGPHDLLTDVRVASAAGYAALEIRDTKLQAHLDAGGSLYGLRQQLVEAGLEVASLNALERSTVPDAGTRQRCRKLCEWATGLECPYVVAVPSPIADVPDPDRVTEQSVEALRALAGVARPYGVRIGFEFLGFATSSVNTLAQARHIVDTVADRSVGLVIDAFHLYVGDSTWEMLDGLNPEQLFLVHLDDAEHRPRQTLTDAHRLLPGDGVIELGELVRRLDALGYRGVYSVELFRPEYYAWDPLELAKVALQKMQGLFPNQPDG